MPITPLHFGLLPVINRPSRPKISEAAFVLANIVTDIPVVLHVLGQEFPGFGGSQVFTTLHGTLSHTFLGALVFGLIVGALGCRSRKWWLGSFLGTLTHVILDMIVHSDVHPFAPISAANPFYVDGAYDVLSLILLVGLTVWVLNCIDSFKRRAAP